MLVFMVDPSQGIGNFQYQKKSSLWDNNSTTIMLMALDVFKNIWFKKLGCY